MTQIYKTYMFKNKDPVIDQLRTALKDSKLDIRKVAEDSGVRETTLYAWFYGLTRRPQHASVKAVAVAMGYDFTLIERRKRIHSLDELLTLDPDERGSEG